MKLIIILLLELLGQILLDSGVQDAHTEEDNREEEAEGQHDQRRFNCFPVHEWVYWFTGNLCDGEVHSVVEDIQAPHWNE